MAKRRVTIEFDAKTGRASSQIKGLEGDVKGLSQSAARAEGTVSGGFGKIGGAAGAFIGGAAVAAVGALITRIDDLVAKTFEMGSAAEETRSKYEAVFGEMSGVVDAFGERYANMAGLTRVEFEDLSSQAGALLRGVGVQGEQLATETERVIKMAADLASFHNASIEETFAALRSGITGESEPMKRFSVFLNEAKTANIALAQSGKEAKSELSDQDKVLARITSTLEQIGSQGALGDLERTQDSMANTARRLNAEWRDSQQLMAQGLLPTYGLLLDMMDGLIEGNESAIDTFIRFASEGIFETVYQLTELGFRIGETVGHVGDLVTALTGAEDMSLGVNWVFEQMGREIDQVNGFLRGMEEAYHRVIIGGATFTALLLKQSALLGRALPGDYEETIASLMEMAGAHQEAIEQMSVEQEAREDAAEQRRADMEARKAEMQAFLQNMREEIAESKALLDERLDEMAEQTGERLTRKEQDMMRQIQSARQELEIEMMEEGLEKRLRQIDFEVEQEVEKYRQKYAEEFPELFAELAATLEQKREQMRAAAIRVPVEIDIPDDTFLDDPDLVLETINEVDQALLDMADTFSVLGQSVETIEAVTAELGDLETELNQLKDAGKDTSGVEAQIEALTGLQIRLEALVSAAQVGQEALVESFGIIGTAIGEAAAGMEGSLSRMGSAFKQLMADIARDIGKILIAKGVALALVPGFQGKAARLIAGGVALQALGAAIDAQAQRAEERRREREENAPGLAAGGDITRSGVALVGERGPEHVLLPAGARVLPNNVSMQSEAQLSEIRALRQEIRQLAARPVILNADNRILAEEVDRHNNMIARNGIANNLDI